jgi:hypothetical protein
MPLHFFVISQLAAHRSSNVGIGTPVIVNNVVGTPWNAVLNIIVPSLVVVNPPSTVLVPASTKTAALAAAAK